MGFHLVAAIQGPSSYQQGDNRDDYGNFITYISRDYSHVWSCKKSLVEYIDINESYLIDINTSYIILILNPHGWFFDGSYPTFHWLWIWTKLSTRSRSPENFRL